MLKIEYMSVADLIPYTGNVKKHPKKQVEQIAESITEFGFCDPVAISGDNIIIEGHGRVLAAQKLGIDKIPVIRLDGLTDEQRRAYTLVHNQLTMNTGFDIEALEIELENITSIDMKPFDFDIEKISLKVEKLHQEEESSYYGDAREATYRQTNFDKYDGTRTAGFYNMPIIKACDFVPSELMGFNYSTNATETNCGVHFFIDDYQFERCWNNPDFNTERLKRFQCVLTPDWSLYMDMPMALKVWNVYRSRLIGQIWQDAGMNVIPTLSWAEPETYQFCFDGIEGGGTVAVSTVGVMRDETAKAVFRDGLSEAIKRIQPKTIVLYGSKIDFDFKGIKVKHIKARKWGV